MEGSDKRWKVGSEDSFLQTTQHLWLSKNCLIMVFLSAPVSYRMENPSQDNAEYINSGIGGGPGLVTSGPTLLGITMNSRLGTKSPVKPLAQPRKRRLRFVSEVSFLQRSTLNPGGWQQLCETLL
jgi:hypothetical protein